MSYRYKIILIALTALLIGSQLLVAPFYTPDTSDLKRSPFPIPSFTPLRILDPLYFVEWSKHLKDRLSVRRVIREVDAQLDYYVFGDSPVDTVRLGKEGWLYLNNSFHTPSGDSGKTARNILEMAEQLTQTAKATGRAFYIAIAPNKASIYPEFLKPVERERQKIVSDNRKAVQRLLRRKSVQNLIDLYGDLLTERERLWPEVIYFERDSHWNARGAGYAAQSIVHAIDPNVLANTSLEIDRRADYLEDLIQLAGLSETVSREYWSMRRPGVTTTIKKLVSNENRRLARYVSQSVDPLLLPTTVIIHDSFGYELRRVIAPFFEDVRFVHVFAAGTQLARDLVADADIVVLLRVERNFLRWHPELIKNSFEWPNINTLLQVPRAGATGLDGGKP